VKNGNDGLQALRDNHVDVVLLDIAMPGMDGIEALGKILDHDNQLPVILNTAYSSYKDDFMTWAAEAYVIKSHDLSELHGAIAAVLEKRGVAVPEPPTKADG
jgi:DNA-binding response OmpR family regulator